jgi:hypothetical protein
LQYFLVPDIEVENIDDEDEDDLEDEEEIDENVSSPWKIRWGSPLVRSRLCVQAVFDIRHFLVQSNNGVLYLVNSFIIGPL